LSEPTITASRAELKYQIEGTRVADFLGRVLEHLRPHRFRGEGASALPGAHHYSTTIYFDTPSRTLLEASRRDLSSNFKIRAREYYDLHSSLAELATDPDQVARVGAGGLSGAPLKQRSLQVLRRLRERVGDRLTLIAVGGIETAEDAWERLQAGATLVQAYTGFIYGGPLWPRRIHAGLSARLRAAGLSSLAQLHQVQR